MKPRLKELYDSKVQLDLSKKLSLKNKLMSPKFEKIVINMALGTDGNDKKILKSYSDDIAMITGQKPVVTKFKKSISNFKTRKNTEAGLKVTLRKNRMYEFIDRLVNIALPRIKDFRGLSLQSFDKFGNYTFGIKEHVVFPEVKFDKVEKMRGMDITIVTQGKNKNHTLALLEEFNFPFNKEKKNWIIQIYGKKKLDK